MKAIGEYEELLVKFARRETKAEKGEEEKVKKAEKITEARTNEAKKLGIPPPEKGFAKGEGFFEKGGKDLDEAVDWDF